MLISMLVDIVDLLIRVLQMLVIVQFVLSLLISFNVVNMSNDFVAGLWRGINALLDPVLRPIRKIMPNTGAIDFSPLVLIIALVILRRVLQYVEYSALTGQV